ncbi:hypothetical protein JYK14_03780 [Siccirubricoccus sp. KC 17139]|uniref:Uncharacterized protein n=1 Tax=Siccirubricoccus soli TaxID=2899147 RepID=A0ABT1D070_9PROT|nr:hypothetical protein [Siccirubricoccus soli]MCO6415297.1 hypothetical protein [Siccirubricoccus soli]MCP2681428.1 hypothetical protein [Siccirubricoccus soli]
MAMSAEEIRDFYGRCAAARQRLQELALRALPREKIREQIQRLGLSLDEEMGQTSGEELAYAFDLAIYTAPPGRSRAIDRVARQHARLPGEAALVLNALTRSWLSVFRVQDRHPEEGLLLEDALLGGEVWLVDQNLAETAPPGTVFASRIGRVGGFAITTGVMAPLDEAMLGGIQGMLRQGGVEAAALVEDPRFARAMWQRALGFHPDQGGG